MFLYIHNFRPLYKLNVQEIRLPTGRKWNGRCCSFIWYQYTIPPLSARFSKRKSGLGSLTIDPFTPKAYAHGLTYIELSFFKTIWCVEKYLNDSYCLFDELWSKLSDRVATQYATVLSFFDVVLCSRQPWFPSYDGAGVNGRKSF